MSEFLTVEEELARFDYNIVHNAKASLKRQGFHEEANALEPICCKIRDRGWKPVKKEEKK